MVQAYYRNLLTFIYNTIYITFLWLIKKNTEKTRDEQRLARFFPVRIVPAVCSPCWGKTCKPKLWLWRGFRLLEGSSVDHSALGFNSRANIHVRWARTGGGPRCLVSLVFPFVFCHCSMSLVSGVKVWLAKKLSGIKILKETERTEKLT